MSLIAARPDRPANMPMHGSGILFKLKQGSVLLDYPTGGVHTGYTASSILNADGYWWRSEKHVYETEFVEWWIYLSEITTFLRIPSLEVKAP